MKFWMKKAAEELKRVRLRDDTVSGRVWDIAEQLVARTFCDSAGWSAIYVLVYVRYICEGDCVEDLTLPSSASGARLSEDLNAFMTKRGLDWASWKGSTSDGRPRSLATRAELSEGLRMQQDRTLLGIIVLFIVKLWHQKESHPSLK